jgi:hypothetical protein
MLNFPENVIEAKKISKLRKIFLRHISDDFTPKLFVYATMCEQISFKFFYLLILMLFAENHFFFYIRRKNFKNLFDGSLVMTAFAVIAMSVTMVELFKTTRIVPIDVECLFDSKCGNEEAESEWESTEKHFKETGLVSSVFWVEPPDFISKI